MSFKVFCDRCGTAVNVDTDKAVDVVRKGAKVTCGPCVAKEEEVKNICQGFINEAKEAVAAVVLEYKGKVEATFKERYGV
jgi:hypothetical protein